MATKQCSVCGQNKPEKQFVAYGGKRHTECRECEKIILRCVNCKELKSVEDFHPDKGKENGRCSWCKACGVKNNRDRGCEYADEINARRRHRYETDEEYRAKVQARTAANYAKPEQRKRIDAYNKSERGKARWKRYKQNENNKAFIREYMNEYGKARSKDPGIRGMKVRARRMVNLAVYRKVIIKPAICQHPEKYGVSCSLGKVTAHHYMGYEPENWLEIEWLCPACHIAADHPAT